MHPAVAWVGLGVAVLGLLASIPEDQGRAWETIRDGHGPYASPLAVQLVDSAGKDDGWDAPYLVAQGVVVASWTTVASTLGWLAFRSAPSRGVRWTAGTTIGLAGLGLLWLFGLLHHLHDGGCLFNDAAPPDCPWGY